jgi:hypothetical protein
MEQGRARLGSIGEVGPQTFDESLSKAADGPCFSDTRLGPVCSVGRPDRIVCKWMHCSAEFEAPVVMDARTE